MISLKAFNSLSSVLTIEQLNSEPQEIFQFLVYTANMNEVLGKNVINKFAEKLGMPIVKLNIYRMCFFVFAPEKQLLIAEFSL